ncbi:MAG TPA: hypothetical protein VKZ97_05565 [Flavobacteriaceae bacterium]|nr:hypothetical protein [Flavobacteriaceae bacterium]
MKHPILLLVALTLALTACNTAKKDTARLEVAKLYYNTLNTSNYSDLNKWFGETLTTIEGEYQHVYSKSEYLEFLKWDAVFNPTYNILKLEEKEGLVTAQISKTDQRIAFLHEAPFTINQTLSIQENKITSIETSYVGFDETTWETNKNGLLTWISNNHPELNGFIYTQTEANAKRFLEAIALYKNRE